MVTRRNFNRSVGAALGGSALIGTVSADKGLKDSEGSSALTIDGIASDDGMVMLEDLTIEMSSDGAESVDIGSCNVLGMDESMADDLGLVDSFEDFVGGLVDTGAAFVGELFDEIGGVIDGGGEFFEELDLSVGGIVNLVRCSITIFQQLVVPFLGAI